MSWFYNLDFCQDCNKYDTIQVIVRLESGKWMHVCEDCARMRKAFNKNTKIEKEKNYEQSKRRENK